ncbi:hypothetical protein ACINK0_14745 [Deinococcus sp. VB343]|uniref:CBM-cenC domain-containing protein n=1 Tax=Deinococcus sp. VB142 TaxID=3112952 RepID=A0AAU6Q8L8_9DEIO
MPLVAGQKYTLTFTGRASSPRSVAVGIGENGGSFARSLDTEADLMPTGKEFSHTFTAPVTNPSAQLQMAHGGFRGAEVSKRDRSGPRRD